MANLYGQTFPGSGSVPGPPGGSFVMMTVVGISEALAGIDALSFRAGLNAFAITQHYGQLVLTAAKANASGRPGPNVRSGDLRMDIGLVMTSDGSSFTAHIGTDKPQGRRLEFGFFGEDSLGRHYEQPPYPFLGPALDRYADEFAASIAEGIIL